MFSISSFIERVSLWQERAETIVSMNNRNLGYVYPSNERKHYQLADNKLLTKEALKPLGFGLCETYYAYRYFYELQNLKSDLEKYDSFVVKPAQGSGGNGIMVIVKKQGPNFISASGKFITLDEIKSHIGNIIFGVFAQGLNDIAIIEERLIAEESLAHLNTFGLSDIRVICYKGRPIQAMMRLATKDSDGKANLHQGGIGMAINMQTGITTYAQINRNDVTEHPDTKESLVAIQMPMWTEVIQLATQVAQHLPLGYLGIDVALSTKGAIVLEVNARPGIEIQNVAHLGLKPLLKDAHA